MRTTETPGQKLVRFILAKRSQAYRKRRDPFLDDDYRDYLNVGHYFWPLSTKALTEVVTLSCREIQKRLKTRAYPFSQLNHETRNTLLHLPWTWIVGGAHCVLNERHRSRRH